MKIGVKSFGEKDFLKYFRDKVDFMEIMAVEGRNYDFARQFTQIPIIIHAQHYSLGSNIADKSKNGKNISSINFARKIADITNAKRIILHPGVKNTNTGEKDAIDFIKDLKDKRIVIENLPKQKEFNCLCASPEETRSFMKKAGVNLCLDINHAIETAVIEGKDHMELIKEFIKLKPVQYHLGGQRINKEDRKVISHLSFQNSDLNLREIIALLPEDAEITIETEPSIEKVENDLKIIRNVIEECQNLLETTARFKKPF